MKTTLKISDRVGHSNSYLRVVHGDLNVDNLEQSSDWWLAGDMGVATDTVSFSAPMDSRVVASHHQLPLWTEAVLSRVKEWAAANGFESTEVTGAHSVVDGDEFFSVALAVPRETPVTRALDAEEALRDILFADFPYSFGVHVQRR